MILTAACILILLAAALRGLRSVFYLLHLALVLGWLFFSEQQYGVQPAFSAQAGWEFLLAHAVSITLVTFLAYGYDKSAARKSRWRVSERTLHALTLIGGTFGALAGQMVFRHKTRKHSFRLVFWITGWIQVVLLYAFWVATGNA